MTRMEYELGSREIDLLLGAAEDDGTIEKLRRALVDGEILGKGIYPTGRYRVIFSAQEVDELKQRLVDQFSSRGLHPDYEPNLFGLEIEALIDRLSS